jgi:hypothetical protein
MLITITELGERKYSVDFWRGSRRKHCRLSKELYALIRQKAACAWTEPGFGKGEGIRQQQWVKGDMPWVANSG